MEENPYQPPKDPGPAESPAQPQPGSLNLLGNVLVLATGLFTLGIALPVTWWLTNLLKWPIYPVILIAIPTIVFGCCFWIGCVKVCEWLGVAIEKKAPDKQPP